MRTVVIWDELEARICFFVVDEDWRRFDQKYVNSMGSSREENDLIAELDKLTFDEDGNFRHQRLLEFPVEEVRAGAFVVACGSLP